MGCCHWLPSNDWNCGPKADHVIFELPLLCQHHLEFGASHQTRPTNSAASSGNTAWEPVVLLQVGPCLPVVVLTVGPSCSTGAVDVADVASGSVLFFKSSLTAVRKVFPSGFALCVEVYVKSA
mmetsp:Transcript_8677/g.16438  ORF Transcript_8677/g.16438 Transcript_8677/m.16438 type:complete len:123 (+) Transcript_8677:102-470(+)